MEFGSIEREIQIDAAPEIVYEVVSRPEHIREWWNGAETDVVPTAGAVAELVWGKDTDHQHVEHLTVVEAQPPSRFSFRWVYDDGNAPSPTNSLLVTFELAPSGAGTMLRMTETGFRERGWDVAVLEAAYADHVNGWDTFLPALRDYASRLTAARRAG
jgi:uncharacterized protein YndB with AHSA1/START domain